MRIQVVVDGEPREVVVDLQQGTAKVGATSIPFRVVEDTPRRLELELAGERYVVDGVLPTGEEAGSLDLNREVRPVSVRSLVGTATADQVPGAAPTGAAPAPSGPTSPSGPEPPLPLTASVGALPGVVITPPMPGKVLEVRVKEGELVKAGQPLLVLEAMKMRNEMQSPRDGRVLGLAAVPGQSVKAKQALLRIVPP